MELQQEVSLDEIFKNVQLPDVKYTYSYTESQIEEYNYQPVDDEPYNNGDSEPSESFLDVKNEQPDFGGASFHHYQEEETYHNGYYPDDEPVEKANLSEYGWNSVMDNEILVEGSEFGGTNNFSYTHAENVHYEEPPPLHYGYEPHVPDYPSSESKESDYLKETKIQISTESAYTSQVEQDTDKLVREIEIRTKLHARPRIPYSNFEEDPSKKALEETKEAPGVRNLKSLFEGGRPSSITKQKELGLRRYSHLDELYYPPPDYETDDLHHKEHQEEKVTENFHYEHVDSIQNKKIPSRPEAEIVYESQLPVNELKFKFGFDKPKTIKRSKAKLVLRAKSRASTLEEDEPNFEFNENLPVSIPKVVPTVEPMPPLDKFQSVRVVKNVREFVKTLNQHPKDVPYGSGGKLTKIHEMD